MMVRDFDTLRARFARPPSLSGMARMKHSAVLLLLIERDGQTHVVFQKRSSTVPQPGEICLPGGRFEPETDGTVEAAALRETCEELRLPPSDVQLLGRLDSVFTRSGKFIDVVVGHTDRPFEALRANAAEVERVFTLPVGWFLAHQPQMHQVLVQIHSRIVDPETGNEQILLPAEALGLPDMYRDSWGQTRMPVYVWDTPEGVVWGITGEIMKNFADRMAEKPEDKAVTMLESRVWAVVGANDDPEKFGSRIYRRLKSEGRIVWPVNPGLETVDGDPCWPDLLHLPQRPDVVDMVVSPKRGLAYLEQAAAAGIRTIWFQPGTHDEALLARAAELGLETVVDCVLAAFARRDAAD